MVRIHWFRAKECMAPDQLDLDFVWCGVGCCWRGRQDVFVNLGVKRQVFFEPKWSPSYNLYTHVPPLPTVASSRTTSKLSAVGEQETERISEDSTVKPTRGGGSKIGNSPNQLCWLTAHKGWEQQNKQSPGQSLREHTVDKRSYSLKLVLSPAYQLGWGCCLSLKGRIFPSLT